MVACLLDTCWGPASCELAARAFLQPCRVFEDMYNADATLVPACILLQYWSFSVMLPCLGSKDQR